MDWGISRTDVINDWSAASPGTLPDAAPEEGDKESKPRRRQTACLELSLQYQNRRAFSESKLLDAMTPPLVEFKEGRSYNFITAGDVDSLSYVKVILLHQDLDYLLCSTWCMAAEDVLQLQQWYQDDKIKKLDIYVGEIFPSTYRVEWSMLTKFYRDNPDAGRVAVFRNHSKVFAGTGKRFAFGIQTSANINTNPRTENGCITISEELFRFYKDYFDGIKSFVK